MEEKEGSQRRTEGQLHVIRDLLPVVSQHLSKAKKYNLNMN